MDDAELESLIASIVELVDAGQIEEARELAEATDAALRTQPDPALYGWLCFYQAELAARLGDAHAVVDSAERCIAIRRHHAETRGLFLAAQTACELLHQLGRDDLDTRFLPIVSNNWGWIDEARFAGEIHHSTYGYIALVRNILATDDPNCIDLLLDARELLSRCDDECAELALDFARTSPQVIARIAGRQTAKHRPVFAQP